MAGTGAADGDIVADAPSRPVRPGGVRLAVILAVLTVSGILAACSTGGPAEPEADGGRPTLTVTPGGGLVDGQVIEVEGRGWSPRAGVRVADCEVGTSRCAFDELEVETDAAGHFRREVDAHAAFVSGQGDPIDCRAVACELRIDHGTGAVAARLPFDPDAPLGPQPTLTVWPTRGLVDDDRVDVRAEHLDPETHVSFALCEAGARSSFDDRCFPYDAALLEEERPGQGHPVGEDGTVVADLHARADLAAFDRRVDCRVERCELVVTSVGAVLARAAVSFDRRAALRGPARLSVSPATGLRAGDRVEVRGSGFYAGEPVLIGQCAAESTARTCVGGPSERWVADESGRLSGTFTVRSDASTDYRAVDCLEVDCVVRADRYDFVSAASRSAEAPIRLRR